MRPARLAVAALALVVAVLLALFSADLRSWRDAMRAGDVRYAASAGGAPEWHASTILPNALSRRLLAVDDDRTLREAVFAFRRVARTGGGESVLPRRQARAAAEARLIEVVSNGSREQASQASNLFGVLTFADALSGKRAATPVERTVAAFREAIRLDPSNDDAKANLELLLRLLQAKGERIGPNPAPGPRGGGRHGAGTGTPGRGY
jgi:hypothetical protein